MAWVWGKEDPQGDRVEVVRLSKGWRGAGLAFPMGATCSRSSGLAPTSPLTVKSTLFRAWESPHAVRCAAEPLSSPAPPSCPRAMGMSPSPLPPGCRDKDSLLVPARGQGPAVSCCVRSCVSPEPRASPDLPGLCPASRRVWWSRPGSQRHPSLGRRWLCGAPAAADLRGRDAGWAQPPCCGIPAGGSCLGPAWECVSTQLQGWDARLTVGASHPRCWRMWPRPANAQDTEHQPCSFSQTVPVQDQATKVRAVLIGGLFCKSVLGKGDPKSCSFLLSPSWCYQKDDGQGHFMDVSASGRSTV
ncbi:uncharacterized protein LOC136020353 [Lathamus discolor]|uniref:uncharacterized protein LOC136020353 n=1 Tax=Lathamus discolor TaxID=678569 RepID=UPI0032B70EFB